MTIIASLKGFSPDRCMEQVVVKHLQVLSYTVENMMAKQGGCSSRDGRCQRGGAGKGTILFVICLYML